MTLGKKVFIKLGTPQNREFPHWEEILGVPCLVSHLKKHQNLCFYTLMSSFTQYSDIETRSHPPPRIDPQSRIRVWFAKKSRMPQDGCSFFGKSGGPECWFHGIWTIHRTMLAMPGDIVDETIISGLHLIRQKTCIHLGLVAWNSWTVVDKPSNSGAKVV